MKIPKTTTEKPYIEFRFDKNGNLHLKATSNWCGGKKAGFFSSDGSQGNTCEPKHLKSYIKAFKERKEKVIEKEIQILKARLDKIKSENEKFVL